VVSSGGTELIVSGGLASGSIVNSGGLVHVTSGGVASGAIISGGTLEVGSGGSTGSHAVTFAGGGSLRLDQSTAFVGLVAGFGGTDKLDLAYIAFGSGTSATFAEASSLTSGTLTVTNGASMAKILLLGQYATSDFHLSGDGHGGTVVADPLAPASLNLTPPGRT
jgi:autotransporter passenger strand-loop-strand repeat protein